MQKSWFFQAVMVFFVIENDLGCADIVLVSGKVKKVFNKL